MVEREFVVDRTNSVDKRTLLDPDRFGYQSLHYVAALSVARTGLAEYGRFTGLRVEIQIRSTLQHAWAEIEHDLGYKSAAGVPRDIRRRFSRIAGLLELADEEFSVIRRDLDAYTSEQS
jgi:ppGpp synthetase/RelA/SpoT-type nucleotidyltranferase